MSHNSIQCHMRGTAKGIDGDICLVATPWARVTCVVTEKHCKACAADEVPRDRNPVTASIAISQIRRQQGLEERKKRWSEFQPYIDPVEPLGEGPGTELFKLLQSLGVKCEGCPGLFRLMNRRGIDWCHDNEPSVIENMQREAEKRKWEFSEIEAKRLLGIALKRARENDDRLRLPPREDRASL